MGNILSESEAYPLTNSVDSENFGVELEEVDFAEFDRRKAPRIDKYQAFKDAQQSIAIEVEWIEQK